MEDLDDELILSHWRHPLTNIYVTLVLFIIMNVSNFGYWLCVSVCLLVCVCVCVGQCMCVLVCAAYVYVSVCESGVCVSAVYVCVCRCV